MTEAEFFGPHRDEAIVFLRRAKVSTACYDIVKSNLSTDFPEMLCQIKNYKTHIINGHEAGSILSRSAERHIVCFRYDYPALLDRTQIIKKYSTACSACLDRDEQVYMFMDVMNSSNHSKGFMINI